MVTCHVEIDLSDKDKQLKPEARRAYAFCKETHHYRKFLDPAFMAFRWPPLRGYGIRYLGMLGQEEAPYLRYCGLHMSKHIDYNPPYNDMRSVLPFEFERDVWVMTLELACAHRGERLLQKGEKGDWQAECPICTTKCDICRDFEVFFFTRYGTSSTKEHYSNTSIAKHLKYLRLVTRKMTGYVLEMQDLHPVGSVRFPQCTEVKDHVYSRGLGKCDDCIARESPPEEKTLEETEREAAQWRDCEACRRQGRKYLMPSA